MVARPFVLAQDLADADGVCEKSDCIYWTFAGIQPPSDAVEEITSQT